MLKTPPKNTLQTTINNNILKFKLTDKNNKTSPKNLIVGGILDFILKFINHIKLKTGKIFIKPLFNKIFRDPLFK